jgi:uncharacterized membrane protein YidH (DUF202 family)
MESNPFIEFITKVVGAIVDPIIALIALAAFIMFIWGVVEFIQNAADAEKQKTGQQHMIWGIIGLAIIFGAQTIIGILMRTIGQ